jgi:ABC-type glycerol-3-phosphate transport system substrate-binding protein
MIKKRITIYILLLSIIFLVSCGSENNATIVNNPYVKKYDFTVNNGEPITLIVDINNLMPTTNTVATPQQPLVFRSIQTIADNFMIEFPNVKIQWAYSKKSAGDWAQWMTTQISINDAPDIVMMQGSKYADRNWFIDLTEILEEENIFVEEGKNGSESWKDMFPNYMWNSNMTTDASGKILAVPVTMYPGTATAYFYNKDIFNELNLEIPTTWEEFINISKTIKDAGYVAVAPWSLNSTVNVDVWDIQYSLGPTFAKDIIEQWDYDGNGSMSQEEKLRATYEGVFYLKGENQSRILELYNQVGRKYKEVLSVGAASTNYEPLWNEGQVAMMEDGMWRIQAENANTERQFEYGIFATPLADSETTEFASDFAIGEGAYNPPIAESFNICKQAVEQKGQGHLETSKLFLQWLTLPENLNMMISEKEGVYLGCVRGTIVPAVIEDFLTGSFARTPDCSWTTGVTVTTQDTMSRYLQYYLAGRYTQSHTKTIEDFYDDYDAALYEGCTTLINSLGIDPVQKGWINGYQ